MLRKLVLRQFKSFADATLVLGRFTVLVGANASGKSNLKDGLRFLHGLGRGYSLAEILGGKVADGGQWVWTGVRGGSREIAFADQKQFELGVEFDIPVPGGGAIPATFEIGVAVGDSRHGPKVVSESLRVEDVEVYRAIRGGKVRVFGPDKSHVDLAFDATRPILTQFPEFESRLAPGPIADHVRELGFFQTRFPLAYFGEMRFFDLDPAEMRKPSLPGVIELGDRGENLSSVLQATCRDKHKHKAVLSWLRELTPVDVRDFVFTPDVEGKIQLGLKESAGTITSAYSASDGTLRFLALIAALLGPRRGGVYFVEEIDTGIHPTRLRLLLQLIEQSVENHVLQVIATTHAPQVLTMLSDATRGSASLVYRREGERESHVWRIMDLPHVLEVLENESLGGLHEAGWFENVVAFLNGAGVPS